MSDISQFLKQLISLPGLSGSEEPVRSVILEKWQPMVDETSVSRLGSLHALRRAEKGNDAPSILIAAHMDAIGLIVTAVKEGFLHVTQIGGVDPRILPGQVVIVHGRRELPAVAVLWSDRLLQPQHRNKPPSLDRILIDTGLPPDEVAELVRVGDRISFATEPTDLCGALSGHSLDNRASIAALTLCLEKLQKVKLDWNVWMVATVQEEITLAGAATSPYSIQPSLALAVDVTFAKGPGGSDYHSFPLNGGPTIGVGANIHPYLYRRLKEVAEENEIPYKIETMPRSSGTDAISLQVFASGVPCGVVSIPLRYMHTPVEEVTLLDIERSGRLLAEFLQSLSAQTVDELRKEMRP